MDTETGATASIAAAPLAAATPTSSSGKGLEVLKLLREASSEVHTSTDGSAGVADKPMGIAGGSGKGLKVQIIDGEVDPATAEEDADNLLKAMGKTPTVTPKTILKGSTIGAGSGDEAVRAGSDKAKPPMTQSESPERARGVNTRRPQSAGPLRGGRGDSSEDREDEYRSSGGGGGGGRRGQSARVPRARRSGGASSDADSADRDRDRDGPERRSTSSSFSLQARPSAVAERLRRSDDRPWGEVRAPALWRGVHLRPV